MKKIFSMILILSTVLSITSCKYEEDDIWSQSAAERIESLSKSYAQTLMNSKGGWAMEYYPTNGNEYPSANGYLLMAKFNGDNTVSMGMKNDFSSSAYISDISTWDINRDQGPVLSFSSYNKCIHVFADPYDLPFTGDSQNDVNEEGKGAQGDYEFMMMEVPEDGDHVLLKGKKRGTYVRLTPVPKGTDFKTYIEDCQAFTAEFFPSSNEFLYNIHMGTYDGEGQEECFSTYDFGTGIPTLYAKGTDRVMTGWANPYMVTKRDGKYYLRFRDGISRVTDSGTASIREFEYNEENDNFVSVDYPECTIEGIDISSFVNEQLEKGTLWKINGNTNASEFYKNLYAKINEDIQSLKGANLTGLTLLKLNGKLRFRVSYKKGNFPGMINFDFANYTLEDGIFTTSESIAESAEGTTLLQSSTALQTLFATWKQTNTIRASKTKFNPNTIRIVNNDDAEKWVDLIK